jgi:hypothetical protein
MSKQVAQLPHRLLIDVNENGKAAQKLLAVASHKFSLRFLTSAFRKNPSSETAKPAT